MDFQRRELYILAFVASYLPTGDIIYVLRDICVNYVSLVNSSG